MTKRILGMVLASLLLLSCALEPTIQGPSEESKRAADLTLYNATYTFGTTNGGPLTVTALRLAFRDEEESAEITDFTFIAYDEEGTAYLEGSADEGTIDSRSYNATLKGNVEIYHLDEDIRVFSEELSWDDEEQILTSPTSERSTIIVDGDITLTGEGVTVDFITRDVTFDRIVEGVVQR